MRSRRFSSHFPLAALAGLSTLFVLSFLIYYFLFRSNASSREEYHLLMLEATSQVADKSKKLSSPYKATQDRKTVRKDFFYSQGDNSLQMQLVSETATLELDCQGGNSEFLEKMGDVKCVMQEKLYEQDGAAMQTFRCLKAAQASYYYKTNRLEATDVCMSRYMAPGHEIAASLSDASPLAVETADSIVFFLENKNFDFQADGFKAKNFQDPIAITSQTAKYVDKKMALKGSVHVDHALGDIKAEEVFLSSDPDQKKTSLSTISMKDNVRVALRGGGTLFSERAEIDCKTRFGSFFCGLGPEDYVVYREEGQKQDSSAKAILPLSVKSRSMEIQMASEDIRDRIAVNAAPLSNCGALPENTPASSQPPLNISEVEVKAKHDVRVDYHEFIALGDVGTYRRKKQACKGQERESDKPSGMIFLQMNLPNTSCHISNQQGDFIDADKVEIDLLEQSIFFTHPKGIIKVANEQMEFRKKLSSSKEEEEEGTVQFSANKMVWKKACKMLLLSGKVEVDKSSGAAFKTDKQLGIYYHEVKGKKELQSIKSDGLILVTHQEGLLKQPHCLTCHGKMLVDHQVLEITMDSPRGKQGRVIKNKQVTFNDSLGEMQADKLKMSYRFQNGKIIPVKLKLEGNVSLLDRKNDRTAPFDRPQILHYALADCVDYDPQTKEVLFSGSKKKRVLFYDKENNLQVSAPKLKVKRDQATKKESVQGIGDVRFSFLEREFEQLRERFNLKKN